MHLNDTESRLGARNVRCSWEVVHSWRCVIIVPCGTHYEMTQSCTTLSSVRHTCCQTNTYYLKNWQVLSRNNHNINDDFEHWTTSFKQCWSGVINNVFGNVQKAVWRWTCLTMSRGSNYTQQLVVTCCLAASGGLQRVNRTLDWHWSYRVETVNNIYVSYYVIWYRYYNDN